MFPLLRPRHLIGVGPAEDRPLVPSEPRPFLHLSVGQISRPPLHIQRTFNIEM